MKQLDVDVSPPARAIHLNQVFKLVNDQQLLANGVWEGSSYTWITS